jgi:hypothetical protein
MHIEDDSKVVVPPHFEAVKLQLPPSDTEPIKSDTLSF